MRRVVIESPYAGDVERNLRYLRLAMADCLERGEAPYASHALYPAQYLPATTRRVELTRGYSAEVDAVDYERVAEFEWFAGGVDGAVYAARHVRTPEGQVTVYMHRLLADAPYGKVVDHANGNRLDNRRANLRVCEQAENMRNVPRPSHNTSGFKGVSATGERWRAYLTFQGKQRNLGTFDTAKEAALAYDRGAVEVFGGFARTNFAQTQGVLDDDDPEEREQGILAGFAWRDVSDLTVVYGDLGVTKGMRYGIEDAIMKGRPVEYRTLSAWSK